MQERLCGKMIRALAFFCLAAMLAASARAAFRNVAIVVSLNNKLSDVPMADLVKYCKGTAKAWPDGKNFTVVIRNPDAPEMRGVLQKLFGGTPTEVKAAISKLNEGRAVVRIVESDEELLKAVETTPGAIGLVDVYSIT